MDAIYGEVKGGATDYLQWSGQGLGAETVMLCWTAIGS